jgi:hypothetical protein
MQSNKKRRIAAEKAAMKIINDAKFIFTTTVQEEYWKAYWTTWLTPRK